MSESFQLMYHGKPAAPRRPTWFDAATDAIGENAAVWHGVAKNRVKMMDSGHSIVWRRGDLAPVPCYADPASGLSLAHEVEPKKAPQSAQDASGERFGVFSTARTPIQDQALLRRYVDNVQRTGESMLALYLHRHPKADLTSVQLVTKIEGNSIRMYLEPKP